MSLLALFSVLVLAVWVYMSAWFILARASRRTDAIDSAWGLGFVFVAWLAWLIDSRQSDFHLLAVSFVTLWGIRLCGHITKRNSKKTEDYRYVVYRKKWGESYWLKAYFKLFLIQGLLLLMVSLPVIAILHTHRSPIVWVAALGFISWGIGIVIEAEADAELQNFVKTKKSGEIMSKGLWKYSRHPNYFGEVVTWWGAALVAISLLQWWGIIGTLVITILITKVSGIPPLEKHYKGNKAYAEYKKRTSIFLPLPQRKDAI